MRGEIAAIVSIVFFGIVHHAYSQCPGPDFSIDPVACQQQNIFLDNLSGHGSFEWDYCTGEFSSTPTATAAFNLPGANGRPGFEFAKEGNKWYAFATGTFSNRFYRIEYGPDPTQGPTFIENLGDLGGKLKGPGSIRIINNNGNWFGLLHNTDNGELLKLSFGGTLANNPTVTSLFTGIGGINSGLAVAQDGANGWVCLITTSSNNFQVIRLGTNLTAPTPSDILATASVPNPNALFDVDIVRMCDQWYAFASNLGNGNVYHLSFGTSLFQQPTITQLADLGGINGGRLRAVKDGEQYYLLEATLGGSFFKIGLGTSLSTPSAVITDAGSFGSVLQNSIGLGIALHNSKWSVAVVDANTGNVSSVNFTNACSVTEFSANLTSPGIRYSTSGTYNVSLTMYDASGISATRTRSVTISGQSSPDISFNTVNNCVGNDIIFNAQNTSGNITGYDWDFDDVTPHSTAIQPAHIYSAASTYTPSLTVTASNGCTNIAHQSFKTYTQPVAAFTVPSGLICTNNEYTITNNTTDNFDGLLQYSWLVDGVSVSTTRDLKFTFPATGDESVKLIVSIPGCQNELSKNINGIQAGPAVGFNFAGNCEGEEYEFINTSVGDIVSQSWDFDDGLVSNAVSPDHTFLAPKVYSVKLSVTGGNSCVTTTRKDVVVHSKPKPAFSLDLPPFSCSGTPSQFHDATPTMTDSNIQSWDWTFGDTGTGTGKNPTHTYALAGPYTVRLSVTTDKGCTDFKDKPVTITQSPTAVFTNDPTCLGQPAKFTDASTGGVVAWQWKIGSATYTTQNPTHTFATAGNFTAQLTVTGTNGCTNTLIKPILVTTVPTVDFTSLNLCSAQNAVFTDITNGGADPIAQQFWTFNGNNTANGKQIEFAFANAGTFPVQLRVQSQAGCFYTATKNVTIKTSPTASFTLSDQTGPPPLNVKFTNTSTGAVSYEWLFGDVSTSPITEVSPQHTYNDLGDYAVNLTAISADGCKKVETKVISVVVPKIELALEEFSLIKPAGSAAYRGYVRVKNNGNYRINGFFVSYTVGGGLRIRETIVTSLSAGEQGTYLLSNEFVDPAASSYICAELDTDTNPGDNKACTILSESALIFDPYPSPAESWITVESIHSKDETVRVRLFTMNGALAHDRSFDVSPGLSRLSLNIENLSPGMYVVLITTPGSTMSRRILIRR